jgi:hypothetical protein
MLLASPTVERVSVRQIFNFYEREFYSSEISLSPGGRGRGEGVLLLNIVGYRINPKQEMDLVYLSRKG